MNVNFIKTPLSDCLNWEDLPLNMEGRVILRRWPEDTTTAGGIIKPGAENRRLMGVAWVYRAIGDCAKYLAPGDSVLCPESAISAGLPFPSTIEADNSDYREIDARDVYHRNPLAKAIAWRDAERAKFADELAEAGPKIRLLADTGESQQALGWTSSLRTKAEICDSPLAGRTGELIDYVLATTQRLAEARLAKKRANDEAAKKALEEERRKIAAERNK